MTDAVAIAIIAAIPPTVVGIINGILSKRGRTRAKKQVAEIHTEVLKTVAAIKEKP